MLATNLGGVGGARSTEADVDPGMYYSYPTTFSPAPITFAIWLPIFLGCCVIAGYQLLPRQVHDQRLRGFRLPYCGALLANAATPFTPIGWSNAVVVALFIFLCWALTLLPNSKTQSSEMHRLALRMPMTAFATWAGLASIVNLCQLLVSRGIDVSPSFAAGLVVLAMATGVLAMLRTRESVIAIVMLWAGFGIALAQPMWNVVCWSVATTSLLSLVVGAQLFLNPRRNSTIA
ncbi:MAG: hypothetical protein AAFU85_29705 [Planctomycetota bacterium]